MPSGRVGFIQIDVDPLWAVRRAYGIAAEPPGGGAFDPVWDEAVPRFLQLLADAKIRATFFVLGADARHPPHRRRIAEMVASGHEIANHSFSHRLDLGAAPPDEMLGDIRQAQDALAEASGRAPAGFRCPGYGITPPLMRIIRSAGLRYDSSVLPSPWGFALRAAARALSRRTGSATGSAGIPAGESAPSARGAPVPRFGGAGLWRAPCEPYLPDPDDFRLRRSDCRTGDPGGGGGAFWEIPVSVVPFLRLPFHASAALTLGMGYFHAALWLRSHAAYSLNFLLHGVDLLDTSLHPVTGKRWERVFFGADMRRKSANIGRMVDRIARNWPIRRCDEWTAECANSPFTSK
ncbi:MAG: polysaccharide deacetylase family protein [Candidatus Sumerlaeota bacterium]|nr:polysaccharide deacetylase family protein [Candidatus Sumerlaeota bacterium]